MAGVSLTTAELDRVARRYLAAAGERRSFVAELGPDAVPSDGCDLLSADE